MSKCSQWIEVSANELLNFFNVAQELVIRIDTRNSFLPIAWLRIYTYFQGLKNKN